MDILQVYLCALGVHWVADFFCQTHEMATKKSVEDRFLLQHVIVYTTVFLVWYLLMVGIPDIDHLVAYVVIFAGILGVPHFLVDYFTSRLNTLLWVEAKQKPEMMHWFFVSVGFDQLLHAAHIAWFSALIIQMR